MRYHNKFIGLAVVVLGLATVSLLVPLPNQYRSMWLTKLFDLGHVPLFAVVTICLWLIDGRRIWLAFGLASMLAVGTEIAQVFIDRSGDVLDVLRSMLGASIGVLVVRTSTQPFGMRKMALRLTLALALCAWPIWDCGPVLVDAWWSYRSFPILSDFTSPWEAHRWYLGGAQLHRVEQEHAWAGRLELFPNKGNNGAILFPISQNWSGYRRLHCTFSIVGEPLNVLISVRDGRKVKPPQRRFDLLREFAAGQHTVVIDLQDLAAGAEFSPLDLTRIQSFHIAAPDISAPRTVLLHKIHLE